VLPGPASCRDQGACALLMEWRAQFAEAGRGLHAVPAHLGGAIFRFDTTSRLSLPREGAMSTSFPASCHLSPPFSASRLRLRLPQRHVEHVQRSSRPWKPWSRRSRGCYTRRSHGPPHGATRMMRFAKACRDEATLASSSPIAERGIQSRFSRRQTKGIRGPHETQQGRCPPQPGRYVARV
jgi:hypothetical protein